MITRRAQPGVAPGVRSRAAPGRLAAYPRLLAFVEHDSSRSAAYELIAVVAADLYGSEGWRFESLRARQPASDTAGRELDYGVTCSPLASSGLGSALRPSSASGHSALPIRPTASRVSGSVGSV